MKEEDRYDLLLDEKNGPILVEDVRYSSQYWKILSIDIRLILMLLWKIG